MPAAGKQNTRKAQLKRKARPSGDPMGANRVTVPKRPAKPKPRVKPRPTNNAQTYVSQGKAVEKVANQQKAQAKRKRADVKDTKSDADLGRARTFKQSPEYKKARAYARYKAYTYADRRGHGSDEIKKQGERESQNAVVRSPVLKILNETTRPLHAISEAASHDVQQYKKHGVTGLVGHGSLKAAGKGFKKNTGTTFSDVLKEAGVKNKTVAGVAGFALDVGLDPTTYVTGGGASLERKAAGKAARDAAKVAKPTARVIKPSVEKGASKEQRRAAARAQGGGAANPSLPERAAARKLKGPHRGGVTVRVAGQEVPGVAKATHHASRPLRAAGRAVTTGKGRARARSLTADVSPNMAPAGVDKAVSRKAVQATRTARAKVGVGERAADDLRHGIRQHIGHENFNRVVDAIEAGKIKSLPEELRPHAIALRSSNKHVRRLQRRAGDKVADVTQTKGGKIKGYVYRQLTDEAAQADEKIATSGRKGSKAPSSKARKEKRPLAEVRAEKPGRYREDLDVLAGERIQHGTKSAARSQLARDIGDLGRDVKRGKPLDLKDGEAVFHVKGGDIVEVTDKKLLTRITAPLEMNKKGTKLKGAVPKGVGGRFVVLPRNLVERSIESADAKLTGFGKSGVDGVIHAFDKTTSGFKRLALATPGFHVRNLVGDTTQAYIGQDARKLPGNMRRAGKTLKALRKEQQAQRALKPVSDGKKVMTHPKYGDLSYEQIAHNLVKAGAARSGYTATELKELSRSGGVKQGGKVRQSLRGARKAVGGTRVGEASKRALLNREDLPRLATAIHELRNGATWEEAAQKVADTHFDYGHLTSFERNVARRLMPFYTWSARNIPFQAKNLIAKPGKYANFQKVREEAANLSGVNDKQDSQTQDMYRKLKAGGVKLPAGYEKFLSEWEQRNAGIPVSINGKKFTESMGLPLQDLNEFPGAAGKDQFTEYAQKLAGLGNPLAKDPVEYLFNYSFFFRDQIERDNSPLVAAPSYVAGLPKSVRKRLRITDQYVDKKTGKKGWAWPGKLDYLAKTLPGVPNYAQQLATSGSDRRGKGTVGKALAFAGLKSVPIDPAHNAVNLAYARLDELAKRKAELNQKGIGSTKGRRETPEYRRILDQSKILLQVVYSGKDAQKYKQLPTQGGPPKLRSGGVSWSDGGGGVKWSDESSGVTWGG